MAGGPRRDFRRCDGPRVPEGTSGHFWAMQEVRITSRADAGSASCVSVKGIGGAEFTVGPASVDTEIGGFGALFNIRHEYSGKLVPSHPQIWNLRCF